MCRSDGVPIGIYDYDQNKLELKRRNERLTVKSTFVVMRRTSGERIQLIVVCYRLG